ncbi:hypothetical protein GOP47_0024119, partial [Adiantum capillus-veneris]
MCSAPNGAPSSASPLGGLPLHPPVATFFTGGPSGQPSLAALRPFQLFPRLPRGPWRPSCSPRQPLQLPGSANPSPPPSQGRIPSMVSPPSGSPSQQSANRVAPLSNIQLRHPVAPAALAYSDLAIGHP